MSLSFAKYGLLLFTIANLLNYLDRYLMGAVAPLLADQFNLDNSQQGLLFSAYVPSYVLLSPVFGWFGDKYSRTKLAAIGIFVWSLACFASAFAFDFYTLVIARILIGAGEASFSALVPAFLKDSIPDSLKLNKSLAIFYTAIPAGTALGYMLGGWLAGDFGWQSAFIVAGLPGIILSAAIFSFKDLRKNIHVQTQSIFEDLRLVFSARVYLFTSFGFIANSAALTAVAAFVTKYSLSLGVSLKEAGLYFGLVMLASGIIGTYGGGQLASFFAAKFKDRYKGFLFFICGVSILAIPFFLAAFAQDNFYNFVVLCFVAEVLMFSIYAPVCSVIVLAAPQNKLAFAQGINNFLINLCGSLPGPILIGYLADIFGLRLALKAVVFLVLLSAILWYAASKIKITIND